MRKSSCANAYLSVKPANPVDAAIQELVRDFPPPKKSVAKIFWMKPIIPGGLKGLRKMMKKNAAKKNPLGELREYLRARYPYYDDHCEWGQKKPPFFRVRIREKIGKCDSFVKFVQTSCFRMWNGGDNITFTSDIDDAGFFQFREDAEMVARHLTWRCGCGECDKKASVETISPSLYTHWLLRKSPSNTVIDDDFKASRKARRRVNEKG